MNETEHEITFTLIRTTDPMEHAAIATASLTVRLAVINHLLGNLFHQGAVSLAASSAAIS